MGAGSRFDQPLTLIQNGHKVVACGPLNFSTHDVSAHVTIDLEQRANPEEYQPSRGRATASGDFPNHHHDKDGDNKEVDDDGLEWMLTATVHPYPVTSSMSASAWGNAAFVAAPNPGPLIVGHGSIVYTDHNGDTHGFTWTGTGPPGDDPLGAR
jgi:hypothetical protein